jgi:hypothetical protein
MACLHTEPSAPTGDTGTPLRYCQRTGRSGKKKKEEPCTRSERRYVQVLTPKIISVRITVMNTDLGALRAYQGP